MDALWVLPGGFLATVLLIRLFLGHVAMFDCVMLALAAGAWCHSLGAHPALCVGAGAFVLVATGAVQSTRVGAVVVGGIFTLAYSVMVASIAMNLGGHDPLWGWVGYGIGVLLIGGMHVAAWQRSRMEIVRVVD